jgi:hypothetical protein
LFLYFPYVLLSGKLPGRIFLNRENTDAQLLAQSISQGSRNAEMLKARAVIIPLNFPSEGPSVWAVLLHGGATVESLFDILQKIDDLDFRWIQAVDNLQTAKARIIELQARTPGEYVVFDERTQQIIAELTSHATGA